MLIVQLPIHNDTIAKQAGTKDTIYKHRFDPSYQIKVLKFKKEK